MPSRPVVVPLHALDTCFAAPRGSLITIVAPSGSGKTELLSRLSRLRGSQTVTVRLDASTTGEDLLHRISHARGWPTSRHQADLTSIHQSLGRRDIALLFDGVEQLRDTDALGLLEDLLLDDPLERTVVFSGRALPQLDWPRIKLVRRLVPIGPQQLRLRAEDVMRPGSPPRLATLASRILAATDGWHAAIAIACLQAPHPAWGGPFAPHDTRGPRTETTGDISVSEAEVAWHHVRAYIERDVLGRLPDSLLTVMRDAAATADYGALQQALNSHAADLPLTRRVDGEVVELAPLVRDILISDARRLDREQVERAGRRSFATLREQGDRRRALDVAVRHGWVDDITSELRSHGAALFFAGHVGLVGSALRALPPEGYKEDSALLLLRALVAMAEDSLGATGHWLDLADAVRPQDEPEWGPGGVGPSTLLRAVLGGPIPEEFVPVILGAEVPMPWFGLHSILFGFDVLCRGDFERSVGILTAAASITAEQPWVELNRLASLAIAASLTGDQATRDTAVESAEHLQQAVGDASLLAVMVNALIAERLVRDGQSARAAEIVQSTLSRASGNSTWFRTPRIVALSRLVGVAKSLRRSDLERAIKIAARPLIQDARSSGRIIDQVFLDPLLQADQELSPGQAGAPHPQALPTTVRLSPAEGRVLDALAGPRPVPRIAADLGVSTSTVRTHVRSIYGKLGVDNRADAVARARVLKLVI